MISPRWQAFVVDTWPTLAAGGDACAPMQLLEHPSSAGFEKPRASEAHGQIADWVASLPDGTRLHVHEYETGDCIVHRDRCDPARGILPALWHILTETRIGHLAQVLGALALGVLVARRVLP